MVAVNSVMANTHWLKARTLISDLWGSGWYWVYPLIFLLSLLPILVYGEDAHIVIHDNLDSMVALRLALVNSGQLLNFRADAQVDQLINGMPLAHLSSRFSFLTLWYALLPKFTAYTINYIIIRLVAFLGMFWLLRRHILKDLPHPGIARHITWGVALSFSLLPFYFMYGLTTAGLPLLLFAFLNLFSERSSNFNYLPFIIFPFYSMLFLSMPHAIAVFAGMIVFYGYKRSKVPWRAVKALTLMVTLNIVAEFDFFRALFFDPTFTSHRFVRDLNIYTKSSPEVFLNFIVLLFQGHYHAASNHRVILALVWPAAFAVTLFSKDRRWRRSLVGWLSLAIIFAISNGVYFWNVLTPLKQTLGAFSAFDFGRFYWLNQTVWYIIFAISLSVIYLRSQQSTRLWYFIAHAFLIFQILANLLSNEEISQPMLKFLDQIREASNQAISYRQFYSEDLFQEISEYIGRPKPDYRVVSLGIHPGIAQYNGFYTLDGYFSSYPHAYKSQFREVIAPELEKSQRWKDYYDGWGSRVYLFSSEIPDFISTKQLDRQVSDLQINTCAFKALGGEYIFSAVKILNARQLGLVWLATFEDQDSPWRIYLYELSGSAEVECASKI